MADSGFAHRLSTETWPLYGVGIFIIALRLYARIRRIGIKEYCADDWLMVLGGVFYTGLCYTLNRIAGGGGSNLFPPEDFPSMSQDEIDERIKGSKIVIVSEQFMLSLIYLLKTCMLCMYYRLTKGTSQSRLVIGLAVYVAVGYVATEIGFFTFCTPFSGYWAVPPPNPQCTTLQHYAIMQACFNLSSDVCMLLIAVPMVMRLTLPLRQRIVLAFVFSLGIFVIIAAILTKVYNLSDVYDTSYMLWYFREASVAIYVTNLPLIWPLLREAFPFLRTALTSGGSRTGGQPSRPVSGPEASGALQKKRASAHELNFIKSLTSASSEEDIILGLGHVSRSEKRFTTMNSRRGHSPASDERVLNTRQTDRFWGKGDIHSEMTIEIERESADLESQTGRPKRVSWQMPTREVHIHGGEKARDY